VVVFAVVVVDVVPGVDVLVVEGGGGAAGVDVVVDPTGLSAFTGASEIA
jgi:hypothetical protein